VPLVREYPIPDGTNWNAIDLGDQSHIAWASPILVVPCQVASKVMVRGPPR
jgi:hypothetical protein